MKRKKTIVYQVKVVDKPGYGARTPKEDEALKIKDMLEREHNVPVRIIKHWV